MGMVKRYKNIIFDLGGVMIEWSPEKFLQEAFSDQERVPTEFVEVFNSLLWATHDGGWFTREEVFAKLPEQYDRALFSSLVYRLAGYLHPVQPMIDLFFDLKAKGYKVYLLSNMPKEMYGDLVQMHDFFAHADGQLLSFEVGAIKPMPQIYQALLNKYQLEAKECLFIDDREDNVYAGKKAGIEGVVCKDPAYVIQQLQTLRILP
jgi:putative hydrolase of the HAD superfamily